MSDILKNADDEQLYLACVVQFDKKIGELGKAEADAAYTRLAEILKVIDEMMAEKKFTIYEIAGLAESFKQEIIDRIATHVRKATRPVKVQ